MPYTYTLAWEARKTGMPFMRAMWLHYSSDSKAAGIGSQYLWGRDLLIAPVFKKGATTRDVYLPVGDWYDWWTNEKKQGGKTISREVNLATMPVYVRAGAIIPFDPVRQYADETVQTPTTLKVYTGANGDYTLYDDDGITQNYLAGEGALTHILWNDKDKKLTLEPAPDSGLRDTAYQRVFKAALLPGGEVKEVRYAGKHMEVTFD